VTTCPKCGADVPQKPGKGRPAVYCGVTCRKAAEYELRRLQRALEAAEDRLRANERRCAEIRLHGQSSYGGTLSRWEEAVTLDLAEVAGLEARLRVLLDAGG